MTSWCSFGGAQQFPQFNNQLFLASVFEICMLGNPSIKNIPLAVPCTIYTADVSHSGYQFT